jgi:tetratricopeptide (TPR) repeat protein
METIRLIEDYLNGTLGEEEKARIEAKASSDANFRNLITLHKEVNESINDNELFQLKQLLEKAETEYLSTENAQTPDLHNSSKKIKLYFVRIAALFILALTAGAILKITLFNGDNAMRLYKKFYTTYETDMVMRSSNASLLNLDKAILNYSQGHYTDALRSFDVLVKSDPVNYLAWFYKGLTCLETGATQEALASFKAIPETWDSSFQEHRDWYLGLALLRAGNLNESAALFKKISEENGFYDQKAEEILKKLKI